MDPQLRCWVKTTKHAMERTKSVKLSFITLCNSVLFHVACKRPTTAKMHRIFVAQKSYWAFRVLSLLLYEANTILILFKTELGQAENFLIAPRTCISSLWVWLITASTTSAHIDTHRHRFWPHRHGKTGSGVWQYSFTAWILGER